jgi:hypothetical protein
MNTDVIRESVNANRGAIKRHLSHRDLLGAVLVVVGCLAPMVAHSEEAAHHHTASPSAGTATVPRDTARSETSAPARATITGEIVEATCYLKKGAEGLGPQHRDCAIRCIKEGRPPFVREEATGRLYLATFPDSSPEERERWLSQVGNRVQVTGRVQERDGLRLLEVEELTGEHNHGVAPHGGVIGMSGTRHLELVTTADKEIRVYLLDEFMKPLNVAKTRGTAVIKDRASGERRSALVPDTAGDFLRASETNYETDDEDVTVALETPDGPLTMNLPFPDPSAKAGTAEPSPRADHHHH